MPRAYNGYFALNLPIIWHAATVEIPELRQQIEAVLKDLNDT